MEFGTWDESVQMHPEQKDRIVRAVTSKITIVELDKEAKTALIQGNAKKPYKTTLETCTCVDYIRRKLPCKHMYRLAIELGEICYEEIPPDIIGAIEKNYLFTHVELMRHPLLKKSYSYSIQGLNPKSNKLKTIVLRAYDDNDVIRRARLEGLTEPLTIERYNDSPSDNQKEAAEKWGIILPDDVTSIDVSNIFDRLWDNYAPITDITVDYILKNDIVISPYATEIEAQNFIEIHKKKIFDNIKL